MRNKITVTGLVQGIGFRPFVAELAEELGLSGQVKNLGGIVEIFVSGNTQAVDSFIHRLRCVEETGELPGCRIDSLNVKAIDVKLWERLLEFDVDFEEIESAFVEKKGAFHIVGSGNGREEKRFLPVDLPTCDRCVAEMHDPSNRRYRYPFISCTACGPRFSIQKQVPYDRETITMDDFPMCEACYEEYTQKGNIRRHAQTIACKDCGPRLRYMTIQNSQIDVGQKVVMQSGRRGQHEFYQIEDEQQAIEKAILALKDGKIGAIKDIGGYHFAFSPYHSESAKRLREFKNRDKKPFAVMFLDIEAVKEYCEVSKKEEALLLSSARPIVLLKKKKDFVPEICGDSDRIGALLPCNPLQILLLEETGPLVMTSGNRGGEPIIIDEAEMMQHLGGAGIDFMLTHDRAILTPLDDSIYQVNGNYVQLIRRARGLVPEPITLKRNLKKDTFAAGGDLKAVFTLGRENMVYLSQYFGDLEDVRCMESREQGISRMQALFEIAPEVMVGDMHPAYVSYPTKTNEIQHHHAHVASVIAEHGLEGKVLGIACDGTGFGTDGTIWGSEFLLCEKADMKRAGHFSTVKLVGGDASAKQADMTLYSYMLQAKEQGLDVDVFFEEIREACEGIAGKNTNLKQNEDTTLQKLTLQEMAWKQNINTAYSSSMGRLFDAAASLLDICHYNSYEGECAILLEQMAHKGRAEYMQSGTCKKQEDVNFASFWEIQTIPLKMRTEKLGDTWQADSLQLLVDLYQLKGKYTKEVLAYLFHYAVAQGIVELAEHICKENGVDQIALSGGSFINRILLDEVINGLQAKGKKVYINEKVPCGDGGLALGQMYLASWIDHV